MTRSIIYRAMAFIHQFTPTNMLAEELPFSDMARHDVEKRVHDLQENLARLTSQPLPNVPQNEVRYKPEGERLAAAVCRLAFRRGATNEKDVDAIVEEVALAKRPLHLIAPPETPLEHAQEAIYQAQLSNGRKRVKLARRALQMSPDCADAYILLANEDSANPEEEKSLLEEALAAVERVVRSVLGDEIWEGKNEFWRVIPARPYLRAKAAMAYCLWSLGEQENAIAAFQQVLQLDPEDHLNLRYPLLVCLMETKRHDERDALLQQFDDNSAHWLYTRALLAFEHSGANAYSLNALDAAFDSNRAIPFYMLGMIQPQRRELQDFGPGSENESQEYLMANVRFWIVTPGAMLWMAERLFMQLQRMEDAAKIRHAG